MIFPLACFLPCKLTLYGLSEGSPFARCCSAVGFTHARRHLLTLSVMSEALSKSSGQGEADMANEVGENRPLSVIDVSRQEEL